MDELDDVLGEMDSAIPIVSSLEAKDKQDDLIEDVEIVHSNFGDTLEENSKYLWYPSVQPPPKPFKSQQKHVYNSCSPSLELKRLKTIASLWEWLKNETCKHGYDVHIPTFERWLLTTKHCQDKCKFDSFSDPVLASKPKTSDSVLLGQELCEAGCPPEQAHALVNELCQRAEHAYALLYPKGNNNGKGSMIGKFSSVKISLDKSSTSHSSSNMSSSIHKNPLLTIDCQGIKGKVNQSHLDKLYQLWDKSQSQYQSQLIDDIDKLVQKKERDLGILCILLRYNALSGGNKDGSGGGFQGALHGKLFQVLHKRLNCRFECFASPLNCTFGTYCSAFHDVDHKFGSQGSFFEFFPSEGCYEANPPFVPIIVEDMANHMTDLLQRSTCQEKTGNKIMKKCKDGSTKPLCFVVVIPFWEPIPKANTERRRVVVPNASGPGWKLLKNNKFLVKHIKFAAQEHGYCEGSQHVRATRFKTSRFESSLFILQNDSAKDLWPVTEQVCQEIKASFSSQFETELEERQSLLKPTSTSGAKQILVSKQNTTKSNTINAINLSLAKANTSSSSLVNDDDCADVKKTKKNKKNKMKEMMQDDQTTSVKQPHDGGEHKRKKMRKEDEVNKLHGAFNKNKKNKKKARK